MRSIIHACKGLDPVADAFAGTVYTDVVSMREYKLAVFSIYLGVGTTGTSTITIEACNNFTPSLQSAIPFAYQEIASGDTHGALTKATSAGFTTTAGSSKIIKIYVNASDLGASGYPNVRLKAVEVANDPVLAGISIDLMEPRYDMEIPNTAIA